MPEPTIKKAVLGGQVVEAVKRDLQEVVISPGERVTEYALVHRLNVSRTPIREALSQLAHLGLLQQRTGGGYVVPFPTPAELRDVIKVRKLLEPAAVRIAAEEFGPEEIDRVTRAIEREAAACGVKSSRSEEHTSELQSLMRISYAVFCLKKKKRNTTEHTATTKQ